MRIPLFCLPLISTLMFSHVADAYTLMGPRWKTSSQPIAWQLDEAGSSDITDGSDLTEVARAAKAWENVACSHLSFAAPTPLTGARRAAADGANKVFWVEENWPVREYGQNTLGVTTPKYYQNNEMFDADIEFNGHTYSWSTGQGNYCPQGCFDVFSVALHEFGHFFGLDHSNSNHAVMFASYPGYPKQALAQDDIDGVCALYPAAHAGTGAVGSACVQSADCMGSLECVSPSPGAARICSQACSGPNATTCPSGFECRAAAGGYACQPEVAPGAGEGQTCGQSTPCEGGLLCVGYSQSEGICRQPCTSNQPGACGAGFECQAIGNGAVCMPSTSSSAPAECEKCGPTTACSSGLKCVVDEDGQGWCRQACSSDDMCGEDQRCVSGSSDVCSCPGLDVRLEGEACLKTAECAENALCIVDGTTGGAVCRTACNPESPACAEPKECVQIGAAHVCTYPPADQSGPDEEPESRVAGGCSCTTPFGLAWFAAFALLVRARKRR